MCMQVHSADVWRPEVIVDDFLLNFWDAETMNLRDTPAFTHPALVLQGWPLHLAFVCVLGQTMGTQSVTTHTLLIVPFL